MGHGGGGGGGGVGLPGGEGAVVGASPPPRMSPLPPSPLVPEL